MRQREVVVHGGEEQFEGWEADGAGGWQVGRSLALNRYEDRVVDDNIERRHVVLEDRVAVIVIGGTARPVLARKLFRQAFHLSNVVRQWRRSSRARAWGMHAEPHECR